MATVLAIGHSHLGAVQEAFEQRVGGDPPYRLVSLQLLGRGIPTVVQQDGRPDYPPQVDELVKRHMDDAQPDLVALMLEGQQAATWGFAIPARPWDFLLPSETGPPSLEGDLLPFDLVTEIARAHVGHIARFLDRIRPTLGPRVVAISPPPVYGDDAILERKIALSPDLRDAVMATGLAPRAWRRRIWVVMVTALAEACLARGIAYLPPPPGATDAEGFLPFPLLSDALHGNPRYGALVLAQLADWIGKT